MSASQAPIDDLHASQEAPEDESDPVEATGAGRGSVLDRPGACSSSAKAYGEAATPFHRQHQGHLTHCARPTLQIKTVLYVRTMFPHLSNHVNKSSDFEPTSPVDRKEGQLPTLQKWIEVSNVPSTAKQKRNYETCNEDVADEQHRTGVVVGLYQRMTSQVTMDDIHEGYDGIAEHLSGERDKA